MSFPGRFSALSVNGMAAYIFMDENDEYYDGGNVLFENTPV